MNADTDLIEEIGQVMHKSWSATKRAQLFHGPDESEVDGSCGCYTVDDDTVWRRCKKFHADLVPWEQLPERQKDINRHAADALIEQGLLIPRAEHEAECTKLEDKIVELANEHEAAVAAAYADAAQHYLRQDMDNQCNCGWKADDSCDSWDDQYAQWQDHIRSLATQPQRDALDALLQRAKREEAELFKQQFTWENSQKPGAVLDWIQKRIASLRVD